MADEVPLTLEQVLQAAGEEPEAFACLVGEQEDGDPADEAAHFYICKACQQPVDMRDLAAVFHHEERGHEPLPVEDAERLLRISDQLRASLSAKITKARRRAG